MVAHPTGVHSKALRLGAELLQCRAGCAAAELGKVHANIHAPILPLVPVSNETRNRRPLQTAKALLAGPLFMPTIKPMNTRARREGRAAGRPLDFDRGAVVDKALDLFWANGYSSTTTRNLESALGISQSSIYNAFGSKQGLLDTAVDRYEQRLHSDVLSHLEVDEPDQSALLAFVNAMTEWICGDATSGCLVLNLAAEQPDQRYRIESYAARLRESLRPALASFTVEQAEIEARTELLVAAVFGLNILARSGTGPAPRRDQSDLGRDLPPDPLLVIKERSLPCP